MTDLEPMPVLPKDKLEIGALYFCDADCFIFGRWTGEFFESYITVNVNPVKVTEYHVEDLDNLHNEGSVRPFMKVVEEVEK